MSNHFFELPVSELYESSLSSYIRFSEIDVNSHRGQKALARSLQVQERHLTACSVKMIAKPFMVEELTDHSLRIDSNLIQLEELGSVSTDNLTGGYLYTIYLDCIDSILGNISGTIDKFFADTWLSAYVDAAFNNIHQILYKKLPHDFPGIDKAAVPLLSECLGPGFNGMSMNFTQYIIDLMNLPAYGFHLYNNSCLEPSKSILGLVLVYSKKHC